jgi:hypothetical protein
MKVTQKEIEAKRKKEREMKLIKKERRTEQKRDGNVRCYDLGQALTKGKDVNRARCVLVNLFPPFQGSRFSGLLSWAVASFEAV